MRTMRFIGRNARAISAQVNSRLRSGSEKPWLARFRAPHAELVGAALAQAGSRTRVASSGGHAALRMGVQPAARALIAPQ